MKFSQTRILFLTLPSFIFGCSPQIVELDADHDGVADTLGWGVDEDGDGESDWVDANHDGTLDGVGVDTNLDYKIDSLGLDTNDDGIADALDNDVDGKDDTRPTSSGGTSSGGSGSGGAETLASGGAGAQPASGGAGASGSAPGTGSAAAGGAQSPSSGGTGAVLPTGCDSADVLCVDFEDTVAGQKPTGGPWLAENCFDSGYQKSVTAGSGVDSSQGFTTSGTSASANSCALVHDLGGLADFWLRAWIKIGGADPNMQHEVTFLELGASATTDDPELRLGYRGDNSCSNSGTAYQGFELGATRGLNNGEDTGCTGSMTNSGLPVADEWYCLEVHVTQGAGQLMSDLFVDGVNQSFLIHSMPHDEVGGAFEAQYLKVGMQSYSGAFDSLVIDDISISTSRIACPTK